MDRISGLGLAACCALLLAVPVHPARADDIPEAARVVRKEALMPNWGPEGRPLPLVAHWHRRSMPLSFQIDLIKQGHYILPWQAFEDATRRRKGQKFDFENELRQLRAWGLPLALITGGQWEASFYRNKEYLDAPAEETGVAVSAETGKKIRAVSPLGPIAPWEKLGRRWTDHEFVQRMAEIYPDIPRVFFVSNNEANEMRWHALDKDKYFVDQYGTDNDDDGNRGVRINYVMEYGNYGYKDEFTGAGWRDRP